MRVGLFGGSFNPPHVSHVEAIKWALSCGDLDEVLVVPVHSHAFAKQLAPFADRLAMVLASVCGIPRVTVSALEANLPEPNYTIHTLQRLREEFPHSQFRLLIGADVLLDSDKWRDFDELTRLAPPLILGREGVACDAAPTPVLPEVSSSQLRGWMAAEEHTEELLELIAPPCARYICSRGLYGVKPSAPMCRALMAARADGSTR